MLGDVDSDVDGVGSSSFVFCDRDEEGVGYVGVAGVHHYYHHGWFHRGYCSAVGLVVVAGGWDWEVASVLQVAEAS